MTGRIKYIVFLLVFLSSCEKLPSYLTGQDERDAELRLSFSFGKIRTKTLTEENDSVKDLMIWLVRNGKLVRHLSITDGNTGDIRFSSMQRGNYRIYAAANLDSAFLDSDIDGLFSLRDSTIDENAFRALKFKSLSSGVYAPDFGENMPMSVVQDITVASGLNTVELELLRVCGKIRVSVYNRTKDKNVFIESLSFSETNPVSAYLFFNDHNVPEGRTGFVNYSMPANPQCISPGDSLLQFEQYVYEAEELRPFTMNIKGGIYEDSQDSPQVDSYLYSLGPEQLSFEVGKSYFVKSHASDRYWHAAGPSSVEAKAIAQEDMSSILNGADLDNYLWIFDDAAQTTIKSVGQDRYMTVTEDNRTNVSLGPTPLKFNFNNLSFSHNWTQGTWYSYTYYKYLMLSGNSLVSQRSRTVSQSGNEYKWYFYPLIESPVNLLHSPDKSFDWTVDELKYIDRYGASVPLENICRNEVLDIGINIFYNDVERKLYFELCAWDSESNEMTFD